jgi:glycosyltransferase involved in cell wall biosynthesis
VANPIHLSIDARLAGPRHAGIGRYEAEIIRRLVTEPRTLGSSRSVQWSIWISQNDDLSWLPEPVPENVTLHRTSVTHYSVAEQVLWPRQLAQVQSDLLWVPHFNVPLHAPSPWVMTLHDLLWHHAKDARATTLPAWKHGIKHFGYRWITAHAVKGAQNVIVPSQAVADDLHALFGSSISTTVTHEGVADTYLQAPLVKKLPAIEPVILYVGSLYPHKNLSVVLEALRGLPEFRLQVVSARSVFTSDFEAEAERLGVRKQVELLGYQSDEEVLSLAQHAVALVQPSTSEGFGLTGLEGLAMGVPVIASNLEVFSELYGDHALYFESHDAAALSSLIRKLWKQPLSVSARQDGQRHARHFTWEKTTQKTWSVLSKAWENLYGRA